MLPVKPTTTPTAPRPYEQEPLLLEVADVVNTTLDLETTLRRVAELVRKVIDYEIFAILLLNEQRQELYVRFQVGYPPDVAERIRVKVGQGITGRAAETRQAQLVADATREDFYIEALPNVHSELAIPLIVKNRLIGVIDIEAREKGYFTEEHKRLLTLIASRMAVGIENANYHLMALGDLERLSPHFDWAAYFAGIGLAPPASIDVNQPEFVQALDKEIVATPIADWRAYFRWHLVHDNARYLSTPFVNENFAFFGKGAHGNLRAP